MLSDEELLLGQSPGQLLKDLPDRVSAALFRQAGIRPEAPAVSDRGGNALTYSELAERVRSMEQTLIDAGLREGDRVMLVNENCVALVVLILACSEIGAWPVIVNARMAAPELERIRLHSTPRLVIHTLDSEAAQQQWQQSSSGRLLDGAGFRLGIIEFPDVKPETDTASGNERVFTLLYTTGTTGDPKGVMLTHRNILYIAAVTSALRGLRPEDRLYGVLPISHVFGLAAVFIASIHTGSELVLADRFDAREVMETLAARKITGIFGVPTMFARLNDLVRTDGMPAGGLPELRFMYAGGAPLEPALKQRTEQAFGLPLLNGYGMTESAPTICQVRYNRPLDTCSVGPPIPGLETRVVDAQGREVVRGEVGELHVRGPGNMRGYYHNPEATAAVMDAEGFLNTGDLVYQDADENVFIVGRSKELIIHSGFNVYPPEVEAALTHHPEVLFCAVVGEAVEGNEEVVAYVQCVPGSSLTAEELIAFVKPRLTAYKRPTRIEFREQLPTAPSGKVLKHRLQ